MLKLCIPATRVIMSYSSTPFFNSEAAVSIMLDPQTGIWVGTGVLCAVILLLLAFAVYKQYFGTLSLPPRKLEVPTEEPDGAVREEGSSPRREAPPPYPGNSSTAHVYSQTVDDIDGVAVEVHEDAAPCSKEPVSPHVYEQPVQIETST